MKDKTSDELNIAPVALLIVCEKKNKVKHITCHYEICNLFTRNPVLELNVSSRKDIFE